MDHAEFAALHEGDTGGDRPERGPLSGALPVIRPLAHVPSSIRPSVGCRHHRPPLFWLLLLPVVLVGTACRIPADPLPLRIEALAPRPLLVGDHPPPPISARAAVVIDAASGAVFFAHNPTVRLAPASLTKLATALVVLTHRDPAERVVASLDPTAFAVDETRMWVEPGEALTIEDLLYGLLLASGNDAAVVLARQLAGSEAAFADLLNQTLAGYGLRDTHFVNAHGLDAADHWTTAADLALLARVAMQDARFRRIVATAEWTVQSHRHTTLRNRNPFLAAYPGADGIKNGWTEAAGGTLVASATRGGHRVIVVLLDSSAPTGEATALLDWAFAAARWPGDPPPSCTRGGGQRKAEMESRHSNAAAGRENCRRRRRRRHRLGPAQH